MGSVLISQLLPTLQKLEWSGSPHATTAGAVVFRTTIDQVDGYRGDPKVLAAALRTTRTGDSLPFAYAGVAYILLAASAPPASAPRTSAPQTAAPNAASESDRYDSTGLQAALTWLEKAQDLAPDEVEINIIEPLIYIHEKRYDDARVVLDYLHGEAPDNYYLLRAEMSYWQHVGDHSQALEWNQRALEAAETVPQRLRLKSVAAAIHQEAGETAQAMQAYKEALHFDANNAWLCHQISLIGYELEEFEEAVRFNERALNLQPDFAEARQLKEILAERNRSSGFLGRLFS